VTEYGQATTAVFHILRRWGFTELKTIKQLEKLPELNVRVIDEYIEDVPSEE
jgi:hypothetical protein